MDQVANGNDPDQELVANRVHVLLVAVALAHELQKVLLVVVVLAHEVQNVLLVAVALAQELQALLVNVVLLDV